MTDSFHLHCNRGCTLEMKQTGEQTQEANYLAVKNCNNLSSDDTAQLQEPEPFEVTWGL